MLFRSEPFGEETMVLWKLVLEEVAGEFGGEIVLRGGGYTQTEKVPSVGARACR